MEKRNKIIQQLIENSDNSCAICGEKFDENNHLDIDHIIPLTAGGTNELENLQLVCRKCNIKKSNILFSEPYFVSFLENLLQRKEEDFDVKKSNLIGHGLRIQPDLVFRRKKGNKIENCVVEVKILTAYTIDRIKDIIIQIESYKEHYNNAKGIFAFPGELPYKYMEMFHKADIEVWDKVFLATEFEKEIEQTNNPFFNNMFKINKTSAKDIKKVAKIMIEKLYNCKAGIENWYEYQQLIGEILRILFYPELDKPIFESSDITRSNRRDIIMPNYTIDGFWNFLRQTYCADYIVIDAKNSTKSVRKQDVLQMGNYLKQHGTGLFGIIVSRNYKMTSTITYSLLEMWALQRKMIIILDDNDIEQMLLEKMNEGEPEKIIRQKIEDFRLSI